MLLYHDTTKQGAVTLPETHIDGDHIYTRVYHHQGNFLEVAGVPPHVAHHDVEKLTKEMGYRHATPKEQEQHQASKKKAMQLREGK